MFSSDDEQKARLQARYERTSGLMRAMAETFQDLWDFADNRAAVRTQDGAVYAVSEITEALRDLNDLIWITFSLLDADEGDIPSFEQLAGPVGTLIVRSREIATVTLRYDQITTLLLDEQEPEDEDDADADAAA